MSARQDHEHDEIDNASILAHTRNLEGRVDGIERAVDVLGKRLDRGLGEIGKQVGDLASAIKVQQSLPQFSLQAVLAVVCMCATLLGVGAASIIFISTAISAGPTARIEAEARADRDRINRLERALERFTDRQLADARR